jgi:uncharacterized damage-inducible protein DinB
MEEQLVETWEIHNRINLYLLDALGPDSLVASLTPPGRTVAAQFAHIHNVRLMWLKSAAPALLEGLDKLDGKATTAAELRAALQASSSAIAELLRQGLAAGKIKGFKPHPVAFAGYLIAHESHHRGQIGWTLKHTGHPLSQKVAYGLWEWGVR